MNTTVQTLTKALTEQVKNNTLDLDLYNDYVTEFCAPENKIHYMYELEAFIRDNDLNLNGGLEECIVKSKEYGDFNPEDTYFYFDGAGAICSANNLSEIPLINIADMAEMLGSEYDKNPEYAAYNWPTLAELLDNK